MKKVGEPSTNFLSFRTMIRLKVMLIMSFRLEEMEVSKLLQNIIFVIGLFCGIVLYLWMTITIDRQIRGIPCFDCQWKTGFPFAYHQESSLVNSAGYLWFGVIADTLIAIVFSVIVGLIFKILWSKILSPRVELK